MKLQKLLTVLTAGSTTAAAQPLKAEGLLPPQPASREIVLRKEDDQGELRRDNWIFEAGRQFLDKGSYFALVGGLIYGITPDEMHKIKEGINDRHLTYEKQPALLKTRGRESYHQISDGNAVPESLYDGPLSIMEKEAEKIRIEIEEQKVEPPVPEREPIIERPNKRLINIMRRKMQRRREATYRTGFKTYSTKIKK